MESFSYSDLLRDLEGFDPWLTRLGLSPRKNDRIHEAFEFLRRAEEASRKGRETGNYTNVQPAGWFPMIEALEAYEVFTAFRDDRSPALARILKRALSGPIQPIHESPRNRDGRNIWFELALAAEWRLRGATVSLDEPDLRLTREGMTFLIACKRPATEQSIRANLKSAITQLQRHLDSSPSGTFGVAAISLNCVFNPGDKVLTGETTGLGDILKNEFAKHQRYLLTLNDPRVCCVLFHIATPGIVANGPDMIRASFSVSWDFDRPSAGSMAFRRHGAEMLNSPK